MITKGDALITRNVDDFFKILDKIIFGVLSISVEYIDSA